MGASQKVWVKAMIMMWKLLRLVPVLALLGAVLGFANGFSISGVDQLGSDIADVDPVPVEVIDVAWLVGQNNYSFGTVTTCKVTLKATDNIPYGLDVTVSLKDEGGNVLQSRSYTIGTHLKEGQENIQTLNGNLDESAADIAKFSITVLRHYD